MGAFRITFRSTVIVSGFAAGAMLMASCQQIGGHPRDAAAGFLAAAAPDTGYSLHFGDTGQTVKLAYGLPASEVMSLMLECEKGAGAVEVSDVARGSPRLTLNSAGARADLTGAIEPSPLAPIVIATADAKTPALRAFRETGKVLVTNGAVRYDITANADERASVERFFAACERRA